MLGQESSFTAQDLLHVDPVMARSFAQLADVAVKKHQLDCEPLLVSSVFDKLIWRTIGPKSFLFGTAQFLFGPVAQLIIRIMFLVTYSINF